MIVSLITGFIIGFILSVPPLGPTYFAILERGLKKDVRGAVSIGGGAGFIDMIYILIAYGGVTFIASLLPDSVDHFFAANEDNFKIGLTFLGCVVVFMYGLKIMKTKSVHQTHPDYNKSAGEVVGIRSKMAEEKQHKTEQRLDKLLHTTALEKEKKGVTGDFMIGVLLCLSSVTLPASWFAIVSYLKGLGILDSNFSTGILLGVGVLIGSTFWFYLLGKFVSTHSDKIKPSTLNKLNFSTGIFLIALGVFLLYKAIDFAFFTHNV